MNYEERSSEESAREKVKIEIILRLLKQQLNLVFKIFIYHFIFIINRLVDGKPSILMASIEYCYYLNL